MTDVVILGGGLAGLTLAAQLRREQPELSVIVVEKSTYPVPVAAHKVGESTVEIGALYLADVVGLRDFLESTALPKLGLRFHFSDGDNTDIAARSEFGPSQFMPVRTWQIDRGGIENELARRLRADGVELVDGTKVVDVELGDPQHRVELDSGRVLRSRWVVDASGRASTLKKKLGLARRVRHLANAAWWRVGEAVDIDAWSSSPRWAAAATDKRRLSTVHLLGDSYWAWVIPLPSGGTSIGIVGDDRTHPLSSMRTPEAADAWLARYEPQLAEVLADGGPREDHLSYKHYSFGATQVYSKDRWALVGDAGIFLDPLYSPGTDFIGIGNIMVADLIGLDHRRDPAFEERCALWDQRMLTLFRAYLCTWQGRYPLMGRPEVMRAKILWDFSFYWSSHALMYARGKSADVDAVARSHGLFRKLLSLNVDIQALFTRWGKVAPEHDHAHVQTDYFKPQWLRSLNDALQQPGDVHAELEANRHQLIRLAGEMQSRGLARDAGLERMAIDVPVSNEYPLTGFLDG